MKIFTSWSKSSSNSVAYVLKSFISNIFDNDIDLQFFISSEDIYAGDKCFEFLTKELQNSQFAIIYLTQENKFSKWLDFESGANAFNNNNAPVCPFLFDIENLEDNNPLRHFQLTTNNRNSILKLIKTIGDRSKSTLTLKQIEGLFNGYFQTLQNEFEKIKSETSPVVTSEFFDQKIYPPNKKGTVDNRIFIGTPMASITNEEYISNREAILLIIEDIKNYCKMGVIYSPVFSIKHSEEFDGQEMSIMKDFAELKQSEYYFFIYPHKTASSVLVEIGYAIALIKKTIIFVASRKDLPFVLENADYSNSNIKYTSMKASIACEN